MYVVIQVRRGAKENRRVFVCSYMRPQRSMAARSPMQAYTHTQTYTHACTHAHTQLKTHTQFKTHTRTHTVIHTHSHTHTPWRARLGSDLPPQTAKTLGVAWQYVPLTAASATCCRPGLCSWTQSRACPLAHQTESTCTHTCVCVCVCIHWPIKHDPPVHISVCVCVYVCIHWPIKQEQPGHTCLCVSEGGGERERERERTAETVQWYHSSYTDTIL